MRGVEKEEAGGMDGMEQGNRGTGEQENRRRNPWDERHPGSRPGDHDRLDAAKESVPCRLRSGTADKSGKG